MERRVSNIILGIAGPSDCFVLRYGWFKFHLKIRPISTERLIEISGEVSQIKNIDQTKEIFPALMEGITDIKYIAKSIAIATGTRYKRIVTRAILKLPLKDIHTLDAIVRKQSDAEVFFYIIISAKGMIRTIVKQEKQ